MRLRKTALALFACLALGAVGANAARAEGWTLGTSENQTTAGTSISSENIVIRKHGTNSLVFTSTLLGLPIEFTITELHISTTGRIDFPSFKPHFHLDWNWTGIHVMFPGHCSVSGGELKTGLLTGEVIMDSTAGSTVVFDKFFPETAGGAFTTVEFQGAECPLNEASAPIKGTLCGESVHTNAGGTGYEPNKTGTLTKVQTVLFGSAQQTTGGCALTLGTKAAQLSGALDFELSGTNAGKPFGAD